MKKSGFIFAILAPMLVSGLAFVSCDVGFGATKTIESLFNDIKAINASYIWADDANGNEFVYCRDHKAWEANVLGLQHVATTFKIADAMYIGGSGASTLESVFTVNAKELVKKLNSFYSSDKKLATAPRKGFQGSPPLPDGTSIVVWYSFFLRRNGYGEYGGSATPTQSPLMIYYYQF